PIPYDKNPRSEPIGRRRLFHPHCKWKSESNCEELKISDVGLKASDAKAFGAFFWEIPGSEKKTTITLKRVSCLDKVQGLELGSAIILCIFAVSIPTDEELCLDHRNTACHL